jgi:hypothetical protein
VTIWGKNRKTCRKSGTLTRRSRTRHGKDNGYGVQHSGAPVVVGDRKLVIIPTPRLHHMTPDVRRKSASTSRSTIIQQLSFLFFVWGEVVVPLQGVFVRSFSSRETTETVFSNTPLAVPASCGAIKIAFSYLLPVFPFHHRSHVRSVSVPLIFPTVSVTIIPTYITGSSLGTFAALKFRILATNYS